ncbi:MAG: cytochrome c biogenesis protein ResB [Alphaproteobacteria bacterium]|nr:cytochrome c biogenesis protein ResB [Alphaproteobacteria bacterium]
MEKEPSPYKKLLNSIVDADTVFWIMPPLMVLLIVGTMAQRWLGLWPAIDQYFSTFIIWAGPVPLPGAYILLGILSITLLFKFLFKSEWKWNKSGIILSHLGALILLFGGLLTAMTARESYMLIPEGYATPYTYSYEAREFLVFQGDTVLARYDFENRDEWDFTKLPFEIEIIKSCANCEILKRVETENYDESLPYQSMAQFMAFEEKPLDPQPETNLTGVELKLSGTSQDGLYIAFDGMPQPIEVTHNDQNYRIILGKAQHLLPFEIQLDDFVEERYGGTEIAKSYHSDVVVRDGDIEWPYRIEMNKPLTYRGYTFYQSSFDKSERGEATILAVVENQGKLFPYIGTAVMALGLLLHCFLAASIQRKARP